MTNGILPYKKDIDLGVNELICQHTLNRNFAKLFANDMALNELYQSVFGSKGISEYIEGEAYDFGHIVWCRKDNDKEGHFLWLLRCTIQGNTLSPYKAFADEKDSTGHYNFQKYGWEDLNEDIDVTKLQLEKSLKTFVNGPMLTHESSQLHKHGKFRDEEDLLSKLATRTFDNIDPNRKKIFFPCVTGVLSADGTILDGSTYRIWDCGIIEFDILFRLGSKGLIDEESGRDVVECNNGDIRFSSAVPGSTTYHNNIDYFYSANDVKVFQNIEGEEVGESVIGDTVQKNRNAYANTYFADINLFPEVLKVNGRTVSSFKDTNYMIFTSGILQECKSKSQMSFGSNVLNFCSKTRTSFTALLVTFPEALPESLPDGRKDEFIKDCGLAANTFHCHIIGKTSS